MHCDKVGQKSTCDERRGFEDLCENDVRGRSELPSPSYAPFSRKGNAT